MKLRMTILAAPLALMAGCSKAPVAQKAPAPTTPGTARQMNLSQLDKAPIPDAEKARLKAQVGAGG